MSTRAFVGVVPLGVLLLTVPTLAQAPKTASEQQEMMLVTLVSVNPGAGPDYVALQTAEVMPAQKKGGVPARHVWSSGIAGSVNEFVFMTPIQSFANFDQPAPMIRALGEQGAAAVNAKSSKLAQATRRMVVRARPDLSYRPTPGAPPAPLAVVTIVDVMPGHRGEFEAFMKSDVLPAMQSAKVKGYNVLEVVYGDSINTYVTTIGYDTYDAIGKGHPFQIALGDDGARKLDAKVSGILSRVERFISRYRPELSWTPQAGSK